MTFFKECNPGTYGVHCLEECHCSPRNFCTKDTGECIDGTVCQGGWTGVNCQGNFFSFSNSQFS